MDPKTQGEWVAKALRCHACSAKAHMAEAMSGERGSDTSGLQYPVSLPDSVLALLGGVNGDE